ncbi:MAG: hypothetical protein ACOCW2_04560, partial [Chitinivibrionales bacterium]
SLESTIVVEQKRQNKKERSKFRWPWRRNKRNEDVMVQDRKGAAGPEPVEQRDKQAKEKGSEEMGVKKEN